MNVYDYGNYDDDNLNLDDLEDSAVFDKERIQLDDPEEIEDDVYDQPEATGKTLISVLRSELKRPEYDRGSLSFRYDGKDYEGVPMLEINPNKFVFKLEPENKMKAFILSNMSI